MRDGSGGQREWQWSSAGPCATEDRSSNGIRWAPTVGRRSAFSMPHRNHSSRQPCRRHHPSMEPKHQDSKQHKFHRNLHLYPIEQDSAAASPHRAQTTDWQQQSAVYSSSSSWEGPSAFPFGGSSPISATIGPAIHRDISVAGVVFGTASERPRMLFNESRADGAAWMSSGVQPPAASWGPGYSRLWTRIAISDYNEAMVVWSDCTGQFAQCYLYWAFTADPVYGPWNSGNFANLNTFGRPALEYDHYLDKFVLIALDSTGAPRTAQTPAQTPVWSNIYTSPSYPPTTGPDGRPLRYLGNVQFRGSDGVGLAVAAANWPEQGLLNALVQMSVTWNYPAQQYDVGPPVFAGPTGAGSITDSFVTGRHFGLAEDRTGPQMIMVWRDGRSTPEGSPHIAPKIPRKTAC